MHKVGIIDLLRDAVDTFLPNVVDDDRRHKALTFIRGCEAYLAMQPGSQLADTFSAGHSPSLRAAQGVRRARHSAIAAVAKCLQHECDNFGVGIDENDEIRRAG